MFSLLNKHIWLLGIILLIPAIWAFFVPGFYGASDDLHIAWLYEMDQTIRAGNFPPRYVPDLSFGFGYPLFNFVFPLPFYIGEIFRLLGFSLVDSVKAVFLLGLVGSALSMFFLLKNFAGKWLSLAGAIIYVYTPYRSTDIYVRGAIGESLAFVFLPLIVLCVLKIFYGNHGFKWPAILGLSLAGLVLTHNIISYMFLPFLVVLIILLTIFTKNNRREALSKITLGMFLGLSSSVYFWLPAIKDSYLMQYSTVFNYLDHFPTIKQLFTPFFGYGASVAGPGDGMSFFLGVVNIIIVFVSFATFIKMYKSYNLQTKVLFIWGIFVLAVSIFMMNYRSSFIWEKIPLLPYFQFPWRFLTLTTFSTVILLVVLNNFKKSTYSAVTLIVLALGLNAANFRPADFLGRQDDYYLNRYVPEKTASSDYVQTQEEYLRLPVGTRVRPDKIYPRFFSADGEKLGQIVEKNRLDAQATINIDHEIDLYYNKYLFPGWVVEINNRQVETFTGVPFGQISFKLEKGLNSVNVYFKETDFNKILDLISLTAFLFCIFLLNMDRKIRWKT